MKAAKTWTPSKVQGLYRHISGTYYGRVSIAGKETWRTLKTKVFEVAKTEFDKLKDEVGHKNELAREITLDERLTGAAAIAIRELQIANAPRMKKGTRKYWGEIIAAFKKSWPTFAATELRKVTTEECLEWAGRFRTGKIAGKTPREISPVRFNNTLSLLKSLFEIAIEKGVRRTNPAAKLKRLKPRQKDLSSRLPSRAKFGEWVNTIRNGGGRFSADCADFVEFLAFTGMRTGEAKWVRWKHCEFQAEQILVVGDPDEATKNSETRRIPMIAEVKALLKRMRAARQDEAKDEFVLKVNEAQKAMDRAGKLVGMERITHHDLRHLFATVCIESNVDIPTFANWLGHKDGGVLALKTYGHLRNQHSREAAKKVTFAA